MIRVAIVGASGYTALESIRWLLRHPEVEITAATSRQGDGSSIANMHPELEQRLRIGVEDLSAKQIAERCDVAFCCLPHGASAHQCMELLDNGCKVIDLSADYRLGTPALYQQWYGETHPDPARLGATPYGLPELFGDKLHNAPLIANPGCYPTSAILPLAPLLKEGIIEEAGLSSTARVASAEPDGRPSSAICTANATKALPPTLSAIIVISRRSSTSLNDFRE